MTWTRPAKCSDCKFLIDFYKGKRNLHKCDNPESSHYGQQLPLKTRVCDKWKYKYE